MREFVISDGPCFKNLCEGLLAGNTDQVFKAPSSTIKICVESIEKERGNKTSLIIRGFITDVRGSNVHLKFKIPFKGWYDPHRRGGKLREVQEDHQAAFA